MVLHLGYLCSAVYVATTQPSEKRNIVYIKSRIKGTQRKEDFKIAVYTHVYLD